MSIQLGSAYGKVALDVAGLLGGVKKGKEGLLSLANVGKEVGGALQKVGAGLTLGVTLPVVAFFKSSVSSAMEAENSLAELNAVIKSTGGAAGVTADEVTKMASGLQKVTKFADDDIIRGQSMLLTFTKIGKDVFPMATEAMLNMAEKFGSMETASIQLGKALNDPIAGVSALRRVGVMLSDQQEQQIKDFMAVGDIASAQRVILKELENEFGGLAKAAGDTTAGKMAQLRNGFDDLKEAVGGRLIPVLLPLISGLTTLVEKFANLPPWVQTSIIVFLALAALAGPVLAFVGTIISAVSSIAGFIGVLSQLGITLPVIGATIASFGTTVTATLLPALASIGAVMFPVFVVISVLILIIGALYLAWKTNFLGMRDSVTMWVAIVKNLFLALGAFLRGDTQAMLGYLKAAFDAFGERFNKFFEFFGVRDAWQRFQNWLMTAFVNMATWVSNAFNKINWAQVGKYILLGLVNGLLGGIPLLVMAATKVAESALAAIKAKLGISSPSKVFEQLGKYSAQGYQYGLARSMNSEDIANILARPAAQMAGSQQQSITMQFANGVTIRQVQSMIASNNDALLNQINNALAGA